MSAEVIVAARGLEHAYEGVRVLSGVDLECRAGEVLGICGGSGSGKSTLLRLLGGHEVANAGELELGGTTVIRAGRRVGRPPRPAFAMPVFQDPVGSLDARWPLWRNITEPLLAPHRRPHPSRRERRALAAGQLQRVGLGNVDLSVRPAEMSVGQCQRAAVLRAVVAEPALILADEPTSALDLTAAAGVLNLLVELARQGSALVIVSHDEVLLDVTADRVLRMDSGKLQPVNANAPMRPDRAPIPPPWSPTNPPAPWMSPPPPAS
jgi:peptide/nickel transport system ATP-binding protein